jgi:HemY protein
VSLYRSFLWWLLLAAVGALAWNLLQPDFGEVVIRWHGTTISTTVAFFLFACIVLLFALWLLWTVLRFPYNAWQNYANKQTRSRLNNGLTAFYEGRYGRAQSLLTKAADDASVRDLALLGARQAALAQEDWVTAAQLLEKLNRSNPTLAASNNARALLKQGKPQQALDVMLTRPATEWSPIARGIAIEAAISLKQFDLARNWMDARGHGMSAKQQEALQHQFEAGYLVGADSADTLWQRWQELHAGKGVSAAMTDAFAKRAMALGMKNSAAKALIETLESRYQNAPLQALAAVAQNDSALFERLRAMLPGHPDDADLLHALGAWSFAAGNTPDAIGYWQRAIAQGGNAESWNQLGQAFASQGQFEQAYIAQNNARRVLNGEAPLPMTGISLQQKIAAEAVSEQRNEHGIPWLPQ